MRVVVEIEATTSGMAEMGEIILYQQWMSPPRKALMQKKWWLVRRILSEPYQPRCCRAKPTLIVIGSTTYHIVTGAVFASADEDANGRTSGLMGKDVSQPLHSTTASLARKEFSAGRSGLICPKTHLE